jgi:hypothetical protein
VVVSYREVKEVFSPEILQTSLPELAAMEKIRAKA